MIKNKALFSFKQNEVKRAFSHAKLYAHMPGFKLLQAGDSNLPHGKLLIVISKKNRKSLKT